MLVRCRVTSPSSMLPVPIYTPGWRETMWGKVSCPRKQYDGRDWALNHQPSDLKSNALTTNQPRPLVLIMLINKLKLWNQNLHLQGRLQDFRNENLLKLAGKKALLYFSDHLLAFWWVLAIFFSQLLRHVGMYVNNNFLHVWSFLIAKFFKTQCFCSSKTSKCKYKRHATKHLWSMKLSSTSWGVAVVQR